MDKKVITLIILSLTTISCAHNRNWTTDEKKALGAFIIAHTANCYSTERHQDYPNNFYERNKLLGRHPSDAKIITYFSLTGVGAIIIAHYIPKFRITLLGGYAIVNARYTINDINLVKDNR